ncbi:Uncharacterised protein [Achromobacter xylosoxidans]|nr:Uncharacterised protein [Achromobacter xylosoxidans]
MGPGRGIGLVVQERVDEFIAQTRRDGPVADIDGVVDVDRMRRGAAGAVLVLRIRGIERIEAAVRHVERGARGALVAGFLQVAVAHADLLRHVGAAKQARIARLDREGVIVARVEGQAALAGVGAGALRFDAAAAEAVGVVRQQLELIDAVVVVVAERGVGAAAGETVVRPGGLERVLGILPGGQPAGHAGAAFVVMQRGRHAVVGADAIGALEHHVIDVHAVVAFTKAVAVRA